MRSALIAAILCMLVLAACSSGTSQPSATPVPPTTLPTNQVVQSGDNPNATLAATMGVPEPGTLIVPLQQTPNAPTAAPLTFDDLTFNQTGGIAAGALSIALKSDGTLVRNGKNSSVTQDDVKQIELLLDGIHFFDMQGIFTGPGAAADAYRYTLTVNSAGRSRTVISQDDMTPPELFKVYDAIRALNNV